MQPLHYYLAALGDELREFYGDASKPVFGAAADSRKIQDDYIFVAIPGACRDGVQFARAAVQAGANTVVAPKKVDLPGNVNLVIVKNAYVAAGRIAEAAAGYPARFLRIAGVTGTNGKTTCTFLLRDIFNAAGCATGMIGTVEYKIGDQTIPAERTTPTPFELQEMLEKMRQAGTDIVAAEVSSHALHQRRPGTTKFAGALFTNLTGDHCDYHLTMENYFAAKQVLFTEYLHTQSPAVVNIDDPYGRQLVDNLTEAGHEEIVTFGKTPGADWTITDAASGLDGVKFRLQGPESSATEFRSPVVGGFNVHNITGAAVLAQYLGAPEEAVQQAVRAFRGAPGRMEAIDVKPGVRAFVDYAHTDDALANVLDAVRQLGPRRVLLVFGCGGDRDRSKRPRMGKVAAEMADRLYVTSDNPRNEEPQAIIDEIAAGIPTGTDTIIEPDRRAAIRQAVLDAEEGDIILLAGKGHENYQDVKGEKQHFDDREELRTQHRGRPVSMFTRLGYH